MSKLLPDQSKRSLQKWNPQAQPQWAEWVEGLSEPDISKDLTPEQARESDWKKIWSNQAVNSKTYGENF